MTSKLITGIRSKKISVQKRGLAKFIKVRVEARKPYDDTLLLEDLIYSVGHDPNDRWCSCSECCCVNGMCTHWDDL